MVEGPGLRRGGEWGAGTWEVHILLCWRCKSWGERGRFGLGAGRPGGQG